MPWSSEDARVLRSLWTGDSRPVPTAQAQKVSVGRIVSTAFTANRTASDVSRLLAEAGFTPSAEATRLDTRHDDDHVLLSDRLPVDRPIPRGQLAALALHLGRPVPEVHGASTSWGSTPLTHSPPRIW